MAPWVAGMTVLSFVPILLWYLVILIGGTQGGHVYFGHDPEYVFPVQRQIGDPHCVAEVGGQWVYRVPVDVPPDWGVGLLIAYACSRLP